MVMHHRSGTQRVLHGVPRDGRPAAGDPGQAVLAERDPLLARPAVVGARHAATAQYRRSRAFTMPEDGPDRRRRRAPARRRRPADPQPAVVRAPHARDLQRRSTRPPTTSSTRSARCCTSPTRRRISLVAVADRLGDPQGPAAEGHRRLRQHASAHAGDGDRPHLRRAAGRRTPAPRCAPRRPTRPILGADFANARLTPPTVNLTLARVGANGKAYATTSARRHAEDARRRLRPREGQRLRVRPHEPHDPARHPRPSGASATPTNHDVTVAAGPVGFGSPWSKNGAR